MSGLPIGPPALTFHREPSFLKPTTASRLKFKPEYTKQKTLTLPISLHTVHLPLCVKTAEKKQHSMSESVKVFGFDNSPYSGRVQVALRLKGVEFEYKIEKLSNKSEDLLKYNPVYKKVPVLLHNGKPLAESLIILEYIDEIWKGFSIMPVDPYDKAVARFWAKFIDDKCHPAIFKAFSSRDEEHIEEAREHLKTLENQLKGKKFFGGDKIGLVDITANFIGIWVQVMQEVTDLELVPKASFPKLTLWMDDFCSVTAVKDSLPPRDGLIAFFRRWYPKA